MPEPEHGKELESLVVENGEHAVDAVIRSTLEPYVRFTREGRFITKGDFLKVSDPVRLLIFALAKQAMVRLGLPGATAEVTAETAHAECGVPLKSCREHLSRLKARRLLEKSTSGYFVPTWAISDVATAISHRADKTSR